MIYFFYTKHRGCLVEKLADGYKVLGHHCTTWAQVDERIDCALQSLKKSMGL